MGRGGEGRGEAKEGRVRDAGARIKARACRRWGHAV